jgi:superfamily II DNA helicase RecQ
METVYFDAPDELSLDENQDENSKKEQESKDALLDGTIHQKLNTLFKLDRFIANQYEAIYSTLKNEHVLLVLPSGPYRELCYLLPSTLTEHHTKGMKNAKTFVLYPLQEQLPDKDPYPSISKRIISNGTDKQAPWISMHQLYQHLCECDVKVVYMTIKDFVKHKAIMQALYQQNFISRLVIEDAHCLSARSQGIFQANYRHLVSDMRSTYPNVPIMALTSISFNTVHCDIIDALSIRHCKLYKKSLLL